jgi:hypothetical protein
MPNIITIILKPHAPVKQTQHSFHWQAKAQRVSIACLALDKTDIHPIFNTPKIFIHGDNRKASLFRQVA